ncbi:MAG TPA: hypothetical protein VHM31_18190, partial [Polyangia bacterium]|nr:hypothetical protein [Polyangia bacterium]
MKRTAGGWIASVALTLALGACGSIEVTGTSGGDPSQQPIKERDAGPAISGTGGAAPVSTGGSRVVVSATGGTTASGGAMATGGATAT